MRGEPKEGSWGLAELTLPRGLAEGPCSGSSLRKRQDSSALVSLWTHLHTHTHPQAHTHTHSHALKPLACSVTSTLHLFTAYSEKSVQFQPIKLPTNPNMAFSVSASHLNVECLFQPTKTDEKKVAAFMKRWRFIRTIKKKKGTIIPFWSITAGTEQRS